MGIVHETTERPQTDDAESLLERIAFLKEDVLDVDEIIKVTACLALTDRELYDLLQMAKALGPIGRDWKVSPLTKTWYHYVVPVKGGADARAFVIEVLKQMAQYVIVQGRMGTFTLTLYREKEGGTLMIAMLCVKTVYGGVISRRIERHATLCRPPYALTTDAHKEAMSRLVPQDCTNNCDREWRINSMAYILDGVPIHWKRSPLDDAVIGTSQHDMCSIVLKMLATLASGLSPLDCHIRLTVWFTQYATITAIRDSSDTSEAAVERAKVIEPHKGIASLAMILGADFDGGRTITVKEHEHLVAMRSLVDRDLVPTDARIATLAHIMQHLPVLWVANLHLLSGEPAGRTVAGTVACQLPVLLREWADAVGLSDRHVVYLEAALSPLGTISQYVFRARSASVIRGRYPLDKNAQLGILNDRLRAIKGVIEPLVPSGGEGHCDTAPVCQEHIASVAASIADGCCLDATSMPVDVARSNAASAGRQSAPDTEHGEVADPRRQELPSPAEARTTVITPRTLFSVDNSAKHREAMSGLVDTSRNEVCLNVATLAFLFSGQDVLWTRALSSVGLESAVYIDAQLDAGITCARVLKSLLNREHEFTALDWFAEIAITHQGCIYSYATRFKGDGGGDYDNAGDQDVDLDRNIPAMQSAPMAGTAVQQRQLPSVTEKGQQRSKHVHQTVDEVIKLYPWMTPLETLDLVRTKKRLDKAKILHTWAVTPTTDDVVDVKCKLSDGAGTLAVGAPPIDACYVEPMHWALTLRRTKHSAHRALICGTLTKTWTGPDTVPCEQDALDIASLHRSAPLLVPMAAFQIELLLNVPHVWVGDDSGHKFMWSIRLDLGHFDAKAVANLIADKHERARAQTPERKHHMVVRLTHKSESTVAKTHLKVSYKVVITPVC